MLFWRKSGCWSSAMLSAMTDAERLTQLSQPAHRYLAMLWLAIGDADQANHHALAAYTWAWADGEPYVNRYELTRTTELLQQMNAPVPMLPPMSTGWPGSV